MIGKRQIALKGWTIGKRQIALKGPMIGKWQKYIWDVGNRRVNVRWRHSIPEQCAIICSKPVRWLWNGNAAAVQPPWSWGSMIFKKPASILAVISTIVMSLLALPIPRKWTLPQCTSTGGWMVHVVRAGSQMISYTVFDILLNPSETFLFPWWISIETHRPTLVLTTQRLWSLAECASLFSWRSILRICKNIYRHHGTCRYLAWNSCWCPSITTTALEGVKRITDAKRPSNLEKES